MKISKKERIMLCILAIVIVGFIYYQFIYLNQTSRIKDKSKTKNELEQKYNKTIETINSLESRKSDIKVLNTKVSDKSTSFYPTISQEHLILELDKLLKDSGLEGGFIFNKIEVTGVPKTEKSQEDLKESTITEMTEKYNNEVNENTPNENKKDVEQIKLELNFSGSYASLDLFLNSVRNYERKIVVNSITITQKTIDEVTGTIGLEVYAMPKVDGDLQKYLNWTLNNTYGKLSPFSLDGSVGNILEDDEKTDSDFLVSVKSITSELPSIIMGKSNDKSKATYVYANNNDVEEAEIIIIKSDDKYYYKYKTSNGSFPVSYGGVGQEFTPSSDNINIKILSEGRVNSDDKSGLRISVVNKTDRLVNVEIDNDDSENARVTVNGDGKNISVTNK
ncbi:pilus assembly protein PilO [Clostridium botulinum]|nr:pilus assembly protein PilO [Clostridium botulinum]